MAVEAHKVSTKMQLKLNVGKDENNKDIIRSKTYSNVKANAQDQGIYEVANTLAQLQQYALVEIHRVDDVALMEV